MHKVLQLTPLEITARSLLRFPEHHGAAARLFRAYNGFLGFLLDETSRRHLESLHSNDAQADPLLAEARVFRKAFQDALNDIFLTRESKLGEFTIRYGVF